VRATRLTRLLCALLPVAGLGVTQLVTAPAANAVPNLVVVSATAPGGWAPLTVTALCPPGTVAVGGSFRVDSWTNSAVLTQFRPLAGQAGYRVSGMTLSTMAAARTFDPWSVTAYAFCGTVVDDLRVVTATTPSNTSPTKTVTAGCPAGTRPLGTGAAVSSTNGRVVLEQVVPGLTGVTVAARERPGGGAPSWSLTAVAICTPPIPGIAVVAAMTPATAGDKTVPVSCPAGTFVHGAGLQLIGAGGAVLVGMNAPIANPPTGLTLTAAESTPPPPPWRLRVLAVCAS
jgi:hypothetical protein